MSIYKILQARSELPRTELAGRSVSALAGFAVLVLLLQHGCTPEPEQVRIVPNQPPETIVSGAPLDSANASHRYELFWAGFDPDGTVEEYFVAVSDSNLVPRLRDYRRTLRTDSIIVFTANNEVVLSHAFWVFAVDNEGERDPSPARVFFNSVDVHRPVPVITKATKCVGGNCDDLSEGDTVPTAGSSVSFEWTATDPDVGGSITGYRIKLNTETNFNEVPPDSTRVTYEGLPSGFYEFLVEAVDNAGAESLDPATRSWEVNKQPNTTITQMFVANKSGFLEVTDFRNNPIVRDSSRVLLFFEGVDDDGSIDGFAARRIRCDIVRGSCRSFPFGPFFSEGFVSLPAVAAADTPSAFLTSNDYFLLVRSLDNEGKSDATPDTVSIRVNFPPAMDAAGVYPGAGEVVAADVDTLEVRFRATDVESAPAAMIYRILIDGQLGRAVGPVANESLLRQVRMMPEPGMHTIDYIAEDPGRRRDTLTVDFEVVVTRAKE